MPTSDPHMENTFKNIIGKGENAGNPTPSTTQTLPPQCSLPFKDKICRLVKN